MRADAKIHSNPAKTKRTPFTDITDTLNSRIDSKLHAELATTSHSSRELARGQENSSETFGGAAACYRLPGVVTSVQHQRPVQPSLPPSLPSTISHLRSESLGHKPSRRLTFSEARTQRLHGPDLDVGSSVNCVPSRDLPATETPLLPSPSDPSGREPLSTSLLSPKTHKLAHGQLVILPSRSLLVDFREGERKKGKKGDEVMVVSPIGDQILLYSAPHLSTPCCLVEPIAIYSLSELPADWYRLYEQAKNVIEHIKRNVPKFVMYEGTFICTLMANEPRADVEIRESPRLTTSAISESTTATNRIRFSRKLRTMQMFSSAPRMSKKTMFCTARGVPVDAEDWTLLSKHEKECLAALLDFLRIVEALEGILRGKPETLPITSAELPPKCLTASDAPIPAPSVIALRHGDDTVSPKTSFAKSAVAPTASLPPTIPPPSGRSIQITVSPRPRFPSALPRASTSETFRKASSTAVSDAPPPRSSASPSAYCAPSAEPLHGLSRPRLQTRFMPGVGWCVRSGGTHYRIMFPDGVALEVDVDEEKIELVEHDGSVTRYTVRDCNTSRKVGDRMKVFQKFLPLFD